MTPRATSVLAAALTVIACCATIAAMVLEVVPAGGDAAFLSFYAAMSGFALAGCVLAAKRPENPVGWLLTGYGTAAITAQGAGRYALVGSSAGWPAADVAQWLTAWLWALGLPLLAVALLRFPDGRPLSPRWRLPEVAAGLAVAGVAAVAALLWPYRHLAVGWEDPANFVGRAAAVWQVVSVLVFLPVLSGAVALAVRYRRSDGLVRAQIRWVVYPVAILALGVVGFVLTGAPGSGAHPLAEALSLCGMFGTPIAIAIAVLRYRLYEIDRLISRTVSYALVTAVLAAVYAGGVVLMGRLLAPVSDQSDLSVAASTLLVAALFAPVRRRVKAVVNRRFDRAGYDARVTVERFAGSLRTSVAEGELLTELTAVVDQAMQPASVSVWVRRA